VIRKDRKGVVANITSSIFKSDGNIEQTSQNDVRGLFGMLLEASFQQVINIELDELLKSY
jgi:predicted amino acid-binding ACT domain protein